MKINSHISTYSHQVMEQFYAGHANTLPLEKRYVHIGMYLGWIIEKVLYSDNFANEASTEIFRFKRREISCTILGEIWSGFLAFETLNLQGSNFTLFYYTSGLYHREYEEVLGSGFPSIYHVEDTWSNYEKLKTRINARYEEWRNLKAI